MGKGGGRVPGPFRFRFPAFPRTFLERKSISFGSTHRTKHSRYSPREGRRRGRKPGPSLLRSTQIIEWCVKAFYCPRCKRLFIPFHSISLHRIPQASNRKRRGERWGANMPAYVFYLFTYFYIYIYFFCLFVTTLVVENATHSLIRSSNQETPT